MQMFFYNKNYQSKFDKNLKEQFFNTYRFSNHDNDKFFYPYEYMNDWEKINETSLLKKKIFTVTQIWKILLMRIMRTQKELV